jgi:signal transduction histidine kinase
MVEGQNLASLINSNVDLIMAEWEASVRVELPVVGGLAHEELLNSLPDFLRNLARHFSTSRGSDKWQDVSREGREIAKQHGEQRAVTPGYTLDQVIAEHQILRRILFDYIQKRVRLNPEQWSTLLESVDQGISEAATAFAIRKGFKDARYRAMEAEKDEALSQRNTARSTVDRLEYERAIREQFVSMLSHDLRTPITSAKAAAELIARFAKDNPQIAKLTFQVIDELARSDRMIRDLLDANRIRSGEKLPLEIRETKLVELVSDTLRKLAQVYGNRFRLEADHEIVGYWSARDLERSIENLAINAVKYGSPDTPVEVEVLEQGEQVRISVHNSGSLITPQEQAALFQPFSRILSAGTKGKTGWGLGLTLVLGITEAHGGKVHVESEIDKGTTFIMVIPKDARGDTEKPAGRGNGKR